MTDYFLYSSIFTANEQDLEPLAANSMVASF